MNIKFNISGVFFFNGFVMVILGSIFSIFKVVIYFFKGDFFKVVWNDIFWLVIDIIVGMLFVILFDFFDNFVEMFVKSVIEEKI